MRDRNRTEVRFHLQRLHIFFNAGARRGVAHMTDRDFAVIRRQIPEHFRDQTHARLRRHRLAVGDRDPGAFLTAMLQRKQTVVGGQGHRGVGVINPEHPALFLNAVPDGIVRHQFSFPVKRRSIS